MSSFALSVTRATDKERIECATLLLSTFLATAGVAQLVEHLTCNQKVVGSIPTAGSILPHSLKFNQF